MVTHQAPRLPQLAQLPINLFGQNITTSHVVIGMLWGRLGQELTNFVNPITGRPYRSGTEYEISTAYDAYRQHELPQLLFYQRPQTASVSSLNEEDRRQMGMVREFIQEMQEEQMIQVPVPTFRDSQDLVRRVRADLLRILPIIEERLQRGDPKVSTLPALPSDFVPRTEQLRSVIAAVRNNLVTLLHGIPGQGKTVMARAVCDQIAADFRDGILWATFGQNADLVRIQREWISLLHGDLTQVHDTSTAHEELIRCLLGKKMLLVCDDIWLPQHAEVILDNMPPACHVLITSRNMRLLNNGAKIELGPMSVADGRELLNKASKNKIRDDRLLDEIAERLGNLALALKIVGVRLIRYPWSEIQKQLETDRFAQFEAGQRNIFRSMDASVQFLPSDQQERYRELVIFPADEPLAEAAVARLWQQTASHTPEMTHYLLNLFKSLSLIQSNALLHDLQQEYLKATTTTEQRHQMQIVFTDTYGSSEHWGTLPEDGYSWRWFAWHLAQAERKDELHWLLLNATYLQNKIARLESASLIPDIKLFPSDATIVHLGETISLSHHILDETPKELPNQIMGRAGRALYSRMHDWPLWIESHFQLDSFTLNKSGGDLTRLIQHEGSVRACCFSPNGKSMLSASEDNMLRLWDVQSGGHQYVLQGHRDWVLDCCFSPEKIWNSSPRWTCHKRNE